MAEEKNIINYTAADIEKYWNGQLSAAEMHAMEKAAMDDPFLADALEGYKNVNLEGLERLNERLDKRVGAVVPILNLKRKRFTWVRAAAAIIIIVGAGLLFQQIVFSDRNERAVAILKQEEKQPESVVKNNAKSINDSLEFKDVSTNSGSVATKSEPKIITPPNSGSYAYSNVDTANKTGNSDGDLKVREAEKEITLSNPTAAIVEKKEEAVKSQADFGRTADDSVKFLNKKASAVMSAAKQKDNQDRFYDNKAGNEAALNNSYNYRVVDAQNNPVPFANVLNTRDNVGTYTDVRGNFNLVSSDSILNVQIRSLGYNSMNYKLLPSNLQSGLVLQEAERKETVAQNRKVVSSVSRKDSADIQEPEVGWGNYNTYVANNIQIPDNVRPKNSRSDVELSFDIDKTGQPINIKVTRSSQCKECDEEAIRLLKEGPKWKRKGRKKATVSIAVDQK